MGEVQGNALALMGNFVGEGSSRTGSVISIKVADGGSGYLYHHLLKLLITVIKDMVLMHKQYSKMEKWIQFPHCH